MRPVAPTVRKAASGTVRSGGIDDRAQRQERQIGGGRDLRHRVTFHIDRDRGAGDGEDGLARGVRIGRSLPAIAPTIGKVMPAKT